MSKKPIISKEAQFLLKLLRIALGTEEPNLDAAHALPLEGGDGGRLWHEVIRLSYEHKVSALAADGLKKLLEAENAGDQISRLPDYPIIKTWFDDVKNVEYGYAYYVEVLKTLCQIFVDHGLTPIILKGYGLSLNYPIPSHRGAGDIDIFLIDKEGNPAAEKGDQIAREVLGVEVERKPKIHHSHFTFKGIMVENHHEIVGANWGGKRENEFKKYIKEEIVKSTIIVEDFRLTSPTFDAIFLVQHMFSHSYCATLSFRQFNDLATLVQIHSKEINWTYIISIFRQFGLYEYAQGIYGILIKYFGIKSDSLAKELFCNDDMSYHVINDMTTYGKSKYKGVRNFTYHFRNRWHHKFFNKRHWLWQMIKYASIYVFTRIVKFFAYIDVRKAE